MSAHRDRMFEDRRLRDASRALVAADFAHLKSDLASRSIGGRAADRIAAGATDVYEEAIDVARDHKGALAAIVAAMALWFARNPILKSLFDDDRNEEEHADEEHEDFNREHSRDRRRAEHYRR